MPREYPVEKLAELGVPETIILALKANGIVNLRSFQYKAIEKGLRKKSVIVVAPTGSGKTLIGEVVAVTRILHEGIKALYLTPYRALSEEVAKTFSRRYQIKVGIATGDYRDQPIALLGTYDLLVVTYEKADHILRESPPWLDNVKLVIVDEIHSLGDKSRGPTLDIVLTSMKERGMQIIGLSATISNPEDISSWLNASLIISKYRPVKLLECVYYLPANEIIIFDPDPTLVERYVLPLEGRELSTPKTSATLERFIYEDHKTSKDTLLESDLNIKEILGSEAEIISVKEGTGEIVERKFSKNELCRYLESLHSRRMRGGAFFVRKPQTKSIRRKPRSFMETLFVIIEDTFNEMTKYGQKWQVLIFRSSRLLAQRTAQRIAMFMKTNRYYELFKGTLVAQELEKSVSEKTSLTEKLIELSRWGVAFHHSGLSRTERSIIEAAFRNGFLGVLVATPTLAAGVNLPARRVIIEEKYYDPEIGSRVELSTAEYKQRGGRAGRPGYDVVGEVFLIAKDRETLEKFIDKYILGEAEEAKPISGYVTPIVYSQVLALIVSKNKLDVRGILNFFAKTFFSHYAHVHGDTYGLSTLRINVINAIEFLRDVDLIKEKRLSGKTYFKPTSLGQKLAHLYLKPTSAKTILDLFRFWQSILGEKITWNKQRELEVLFAISASPESLTILRRLLGKLDSLVDLVSSNTQVVNALNSFVPSDFLRVIEYGGRYMDADDEELLTVLGGTIILQKWIQGIPISNILEPFLPNFGPGDLNELIRVSSWLAYCAAELGATFGLPLNVVERMKILTKKIRYGVTEDLLILVENIEGIGRTRALALRRAGLSSLEKISKASISDLKRVEGIGDILAERLKTFAKMYLTKTKHRKT